MISKILSAPIYCLFRPKPLILSTAYGFCSTPYQRQEHNPLRNKIMDLSSFEQFNSFFKDRKQQFDASCYSIASRTLAKILIESRLNINFQNREFLKAYLSGLEKVDLQTMSLQQFSHLLYLLRIIKLDPNNNNSFVNAYIRSILDRAEGKMKQLQADSSLNRLCYFYQQLCGLASRNAQNVAKRINFLIKDSNNDSEVQRETQSLSVSDINLILKGMKCKNLLSNDQSMLVRSLIKTAIAKHLQNISFLELAQISVGLNEVLTYNNIDSGVIGQAEQIHKKVLANIDEMDEKSIMYILNARKSNNRSYNQIHKVIFEKILDEIQPNGQSSFNQLFTLRLFGGISNKVKLSQASVQNQDKFFSFLKHTVTKTPRFVHSFVESYIEKGFFSYNELVKIVQILESIPDFSYRLTLLYELSLRRIDVEKIFDYGNLKENDLKDRYLVMVVTILENLIEKNSPNKQKFRQSVNNLKERLFELYKVEDQSFNKFIFNFDTKCIQSLYKYFNRDIAQKLPNPFQAQPISDKYRNAWLKYLVYGASQSDFLKYEVNPIKSNIKKTDLEYLFRIAAFEKHQGGNYVTNILSLASKCLDTITADKTLMITMVRFITIESQKIFESSGNQVARSKFWHILNECYEKSQAPVYFSAFSPIINNLLRSNLYAFKYSQQYQTFLIKLMEKSESFTSRFLLTDLLKELLRLHLIKRQNLQKLGPKMKQIGSESDKLMLRMIQTNEYAFQGVQMTKTNLYLFLFNLCPEMSTFVNKNSQKINSLIEQMKPRQIWKCIINYRLGYKKTQVALLDNLFKNLNKFNINFEQNSPVFAGEILKRNHLAKYQHNIDNIKVFLRKSLDFFAQKNKTARLNLEDHVSLIKCANQFKIRNEEYMHAVLDRFSFDQSIYSREMFLTCGLVGLELNARQLNRLTQQKGFFVQYSSSFSKCFNIFLLFEDQLKNPGEYLKLIIKKYNEIKEKEKIPIFSLYFEYLKKAYPEETKDFEPNSIDKADFCKSLEFINLKYLFNLRNIIEEATETKWVQSQIFSNHYYTFRNLAFLFPSQSKYHNENILIKKIMKTLTGIQKFVIINKNITSLKNTIKYITINYKDTFTQVQEEKIYNKIAELERIRREGVAAGVQVEVQAQTTSESIEQASPAKQN